MPEHICHARGCNTPVPPKMLMCGPHWRMVPKTLQRRVWSAYNRGQEVGDAPVTKAWHVAADAAIQAVWDKENPPGGTQTSAGV